MAERSSAQRDVERAIHHVEMAIELLEKVLSRVAHTASERRAREAEDVARARAEAAAGVESLRMEPTTRGAMLVAVGNRGPFPLERQLATLLGILAAGPRDACDGLVVWKRRDEVIAALAKQTGRAVDAKRLNQLVHKLREAFRHVGQNRWLVQRRGAGDALALRFARRA
jgi:hypothetical protein